VINIVRPDLLGTKVRPHVGGSASTTACTVASSELAETRVHSVDPRDFRTVHHGTVLPTVCGGMCVMCAWCVCMCVCVCVCVCVCA
jgi:hypothetical protein